MSGGPRGFQRFLALPEDELAVLRQRAREAARSEDAAPSGEALELLEIHSRGQSFAVPVSNVEGIVELYSLASLPRAPAHLRGLVSFHGEILLAIELGPLLGSATTGFADLRRVIALRAGESKLAVLAEKVLAVRTALVSSFHADPMHSVSFVRGTDDQFVSLLEPAALIAHAFASVRKGSP